MISQRDCIVGVCMWSALQPTADPVDRVGPSRALVDADFFILQCAAKDLSGFLDFPAVKQADEFATR